MIAAPNMERLSLGAIMLSMGHIGKRPNAFPTGAPGFGPYVKNAGMFITRNPNGARFEFNMNLANSVASGVPHPEAFDLSFDSRSGPEGGRPARPQTVKSRS